jgi:CBS domain-containing protein
MLIAQVLQAKGHAVHTVPATTSVAEAVAELRTHNVGALVVSDDGPGRAGIISERDIVRALATEGAAILERPVAQFMTADLATCGLRTTVDDLMRLMTERRIRHVPVLDGDRLVGIVSIGDVVKSRIDELQEEANTLHDYLVSGRGA